MDAAKTCHFHNDSQAGELELQVGDDEDYADQCDDGFQIAASITYAEEIGLRLEPEFSAGFPHLRKDEERDHVHQRLIGEDVEDRAAPGVGPTAGAEKGEGGVDLAGHEEPDQDEAEATAADGPLLEVHFAAKFGGETD